VGAAMGERQRTVVLQEREPAPHVGPGFAGQYSSLSRRL
jgi:hypothetical protein